MTERLQYWSDHLDQIVAKGVTTQAYARHEAFAAGALYYWRRRLKVEAPGGSGPAGMSSGRFLVPVEIVSEVAGNTGACTLTLVPGIQLALAELSPPDWLSRVVVQTAGTS